MPHRVRVAMGVGGRGGVCSQVASRAPRCGWVWLRVAAGVGGVGAFCASFAAQFGRGRLSAST